MQESHRESRIQTATIQRIEEDARRTAGDPGHCLAIFIRPEVLHYDCFASDRSRNRDQFRPRACVSHISRSRRRQRATSSVFAHEMMRRHGRLRAKGDDCCLSPRECEAVTNVRGISRRRPRETVPSRKILACVSNFVILLPGLS